MNKSVLFCFFSLSFIFNSFAQTFNLTVTNGYGSGTYSVGDTVHIWSKAYDNTKTFSTWSGNIQFLANPTEWHTTLVMPNQNVNVSAEIVNMPTYSIAYEQIMGQNNLKNVYYFFPPYQKGVLYLFHGTGGQAANWTTNVEYRSFVNAAIADTFGIIITEAEEITLNTDLNSDGKLRWQGFPVDTINGIDYLNIKAITDTFVNRGDFPVNTKKFSVGMSNGGSYSAAISHAFSFEAGVSYCASSIQPIFNVRTSPYAFRMAKFDDNAEVGPEGNYEAWQNDSILASRGICHDYKIMDRQPIYPERFSRISGVSVATSQGIFNELVTNNQLDNDHFALHSDTIKAHIIATPSAYPNFVSLGTGDRLEVLNQIASANSEHKFYSDFNFETLKFLNERCNSSVGLNEITNEENEIFIFPNPASEIVTVAFNESISSFQLINSIGGKVYETENVAAKNTIDVSEFEKGVYFIQAISSNKVLFTKFVIE
jgi:hypothetical protein